ncbi:MAG: DNA-directed RNA polymerase subunit beta [Candidatus Sumerlaeaceae bacterium]|nr:DNA-directed RNA polymerase subunit beta [Candidatus Sumerlaeaceae bacterium]
MAKSNGRIPFPTDSNGRVNFARIPEIMEIPYLLETQKKSYSEFLQFHVPPDMRKNVGLQEAFKSVFPITSPNTPSTLDFLEYTFGTPKYTVKECMERGLTYGAPLKAKLQLVVREINPETSEGPTIKDIKEQEVYLGEIPLMTEQGTFIVNGSERVIVSQLHRSPGVSFSSSIHPNGKTTYSARVIPYRGAWVEFEVDINNVMYVMVDRKRKIPATTFLRCFGVADDQGIVERFFETEKVALDDFSKGAVKVSDLIEKYLGSEFTFIEEIVDPKTKKVLVPRGARVTKKATEMLRSHGIEKVHLNVAEGYDHVLGRRLGADVVDPQTGEILAECFEKISTTLLRRFAIAGLRSIVLIKPLNEEENVILSTLAKDKSKSVEDALIEFFKRMRPGNPISIQSARRLFDDMFNTEKRYDLGLVGRHRMNRRFKLKAPNEYRLLSRDDVVGIMSELARIAQTDDEIDDIDHLGHRRVRSVGELLQNQVRAGLAEIEKTARERMAIVDVENLMPHNLINSKPLASAIKDFFGRSQLSQFMDQTNPLSELTHKRRLSALGPGGLSRDRAGFEVRDVHHTHYGRICPIETPEGPNIGLISSLSTYARINDYGFIESPYRRVKDGVVTKDIVYMTADEEDEYIVAQANTPLDERGRIMASSVLTRVRDDFPIVPPDKVRFMDVSPKQLVSVSAALIPFLEHDDANRALMGSNMQRQAVPLLFTEAPVVGTGMERKCAVDSGACVIARSSGKVKRVTATEIVVERRDKQLETYPLVKLKRSNQDTCINQKPIVNEGDEIKAGQVIADGPAIKDGELALGRNLLVAFMPFGGYNFEDAILLSERMVSDDVFTSIHIQDFDVDARDTKLGKEEITRDIPNVSEEALAKLDENGLIIVGSEVKPGDILVGKVTPKGETELTAEEKLLRAIFGEKAGDVRDASLKVPSGTYGTVVDVRVFSRKERTGKTEKEDKQRISEIERERDAELAQADDDFTERLRELLGRIDKPIVNYETGEVELKPGQRVHENCLTYVKRSLRTGMLPVEGSVAHEIKQLYRDHHTRVSTIDEVARNKIDRIKAGDELPPGVIKQVKVYVATKRKIQVGDKMAGRHGNKGVVARILPIEDMPYLADGTPVDIVLNPLGVPSRMNVGQILETYLGWAATALGVKVATPVFDGAREPEICELLRLAREKKLEEAGDKRKFEDLSPEEALLDVNPTGQVTLFDGATGEPFDRPVTVGYMYMMKLAHLVDDKMHARSTGPYSLVTQQPLGGKAQFGGQRFGEMEVWALEAYGAAYTLQELLTVKSDDVAGRTKIYQSIIKGDNHLQPGIPESFNVLVKELQGLGLNMELLTEESSLSESAMQETGLSQNMMATVGDDDMYSGADDFDADDDQL